MGASSKKSFGLDLRMKLEQSVYQRMDFSKTLEDSQVQKIIAEVIQELADWLPFRERMRCERELFYSIRGLDVLSELLEQDDISEIMVNHAGQIFIEQQGKLFLSHRQFPSVEKLENVIQKIVAQVNRRVNESAPIADARLPDGSRVNIVLPPVSLQGPAITIRKFPKNPLTMENLIEKKTIPESWAEYLHQMVLDRKNIFISGGTGTGKTTFLNVLSQYIPPGERVITIEDSAELQLKTIPNLVSLEAREANLEGENAVTIRQLIRTALRMRPDRIVVGEVRGEEVIDMLQAMNTGHAGSLSTGHGNSAEDMLYRLEMMTLMGLSISLEAVRRQIGSALDILIHLGRDSMGARKVITIHRVKGVSKEGYELEELYHV